ncbi:TonB-dependent receptor [Vulcaniibacterium tengchongense]|uniref:TonB-dependent receptor-like protein n=1 Tax=Vulcaniibacterium tengchongense TaxID=1273429 RepID=A0A3N4VTB2_9GAMM|nr:TonB-dependent receptor [Vulcaniibacterium tengchongense]RPE77050.1 TonB-dependent receptor-like protein [Vulcaniibacterium tengchongense]
MKGRTLRRAALGIALGACIASMAPMTATAQAVSGAVAGNANAGDQIVVTSVDTGLSRTTTADANGNYRIAQLPVGTYSLQVIRNGQPIGQPVEVTVSLGSATTVNLDAGGAVDLAAVRVVGSRVVPLVDVTSTESAMTLTTEEVARLPVDRDLTSVALIAPGVTKGDASFGGISFGGSSVAENAFYINGLNVTDFYNRNGFSEAPFAFYKEFQVKTGGYSVEFGRTTGGVINTVARSGTNQFEYGAELAFEPRAWQSSARDRYFDGERYLTFGKDDYSSTTLDVWASGPIIKDRLFFFALYEVRDYQPTNTDDEGELLTKNDSNDGFWGGTLDWYITDNNILSLMAFSDKNETVGDVFGYDYDSDTILAKQNEVYSDTGGDNWAVTWTSNFTQDFSMKLMYGENQRQAFTRSLLDLECNRVVAVSAIPRPPGVQLGCSTNSSVFSREDVREQARADFEWSLGDHLLRFGVDHETNTSDHIQYYAGPGAIYYNVYDGAPGSSIPNPPGGVVPPGYNGYVRARRYEIFGNFESTNSAFYLEDNWNITPNLLLNIGIRNEAFDNKDAEGRTYIKMDDMWAPRFGFSWDMKGDGTTKIFGNVGRYYLPVANVINIKQAGALLDERTYYAFDGWEIRELNGVQYAVPRLGPQIGGVDTSQGDGTVGDLRSEVDRDMDPVYQDEAILGFQQMINDTWSWGVRGIYRRLHDAIDDMEISATPQCGGDGYVGWVMANPGKPVTVWGDSNCDGQADGWITIDTSKEGWAMYDAAGNYLGQRGWVEPKRTYKAVELQLDRAWDDKWSFNASYTWSKSEGNAEGPVNSDTNFSDTGRTENFDDPWVNLGGYGPLANDREHQLKLRGTYAFNDHWQVAATLDVQSGGPITGFGAGNPYDAKKYHSYFVCVSNCMQYDEDTGIDPDGPDVYEHSRRGGRGRMPWTYDLGASLTYLNSFGGADLKVKFAVYNLLNQQRTVRVDQELQPSVGMDGGQPEYNEFFGVGYGFQAPRYAQLVVTVNF